MLSEKLLTAVVEETPAAAIAYVGGQTAGSSGTTSNISFGITSLSGGLASAPATGDLVVIFWCIGSDGTTPTTSQYIDGYTELTRVLSPDTESRQATLIVGYKVMGATPDTSVTMIGGTASNRNAGVVAIYVWRNVGTVGSYTTATGVGTMIPTPPAITPTQAGSVVLSVGNAASSRNNRTYTSSDLSNFITDWQSDSANAHVGVGSFAWTSGTFTPATFGLSGSDQSGNEWTALSMILEP
jgi:hypothetical protein